MAGFLSVIMYSVQDSLSINVDFHMQNYWHLVVIILFRLENNATPIIEPHREKTGFLPRRKQRRRSASR